MNTTHAAHRAGILVLGLVGLAAGSCQRRPGGPVTLDGGFFEVMGTFAHVIVVAPDPSTAERCLEAARNEIIRIDEQMSDYKAQSPLSQLNRSAHPDAVTVDRELFDLLCTSLEYSRRTNGAFDITVGPLVDLWRKAVQEQRRPSEQELAQARAKVGYDKLVLQPEPPAVRFAVEGMRLDLGGIAKGYAVDRAVEQLRSTGGLGGLVDIGGDLRCFGLPPRGKKNWSIGLQDPGRPEGILLRLGLHDAAVATSGDYRRFVQIDGDKLSHIIDPASRRGAQGLSSVTIIAPTALQADALATAVSVLGPQKGLDLIEGTPGVEALLIPSDKPDQMLRTRQASRYMQ